MNDMTILFLTANRVPKGWAEYHRRILVEAARDNKILAISREPITWTENLIQDGEISAANIYRQMWRGAKMATTPYVGIAEDDTLYHHEHFNWFRPKDAVGYNLNCWQLHTWEPIYYYRRRAKNFTMMAPRELLIKALDVIFEKYPHGIPEERVGEIGRTNIERRLGIPHVPVIEFETTIGVVTLQHKYGLDPYEKNQRKRMGKIRAFDIPHWGKSEEIVKNFI